nr:SEC7 and Pleckstrin homology and Ankyrin domain containing protein [Haemonchus contortus]
MSQLRILRKRKMELMNEIDHIKSELRDVDAELESLYYVDEGSRSRHKLIFTGKKKFNQDPVRGIEYLTDRGLLSRQPSAIAQWLYKGEGLSKTAIGELLGLHEPFYLEVLDHFVLCHTFQNMFIVDALRAFLWSFRLPGESQKIDRIMEKFAQQYVATNEGVFDNADTCFTIAYSCIMLNTLLHNPNVKDRPTFERYQSMNKELLEAGSVSTATLAQIYDSIRSREFQIPCDDAARLDNVFLHPDREGWLCKQSSSQFISGPLSWKRRWFVLSDSCLYYFDQTTDKEPRGIIPLQNVGVRRVESASRPFMFEIFSLSEDGRIKACKTEQTGKMVEGRHTVYRICASSAEDLNAWLEVSISLHDLRWQTGAVEELSLKTANEEGANQQPSHDDDSQVYEEFDPFKGPEEGHKCTSCDWSMAEDDRENIITHYRSQWHRFNARNLLKGRQPLTEDQFEMLGEEERKASDEAPSSSTDSDDSDVEDLPMMLGSSHIYFTHNDEVFSMYRCLLHHGESTISLATFSRPLDCAIFLLAGGHFAAGIFKDDKLVAHKAFHRYVIRAKQGGVQSSKDKEKGTIHSAGAALRRYNERALAQDIVKVLETWSKLLDSTPLIFIRCASFQRVIFHDIDGSGFDRKDPRLRTIPFETKRPLLEEVRRTWERLGSVTCHGLLKDFLAERSKRKQKAKTLLKKKRTETRWRVDPYDEEKTPPRERKTDHLKPVVPVEEQQHEADRWPTLNKTTRRELYSMVKENKEDTLAALICGCNKEEQKEITDYLSTNRFSADNGTFLHLAARSGADRVLQYLLETGCDPSIKDDNDLVPYALSANKSIKQVFIRFRSENPKRWDWIRCHIPEPIQLTDEQLAKLSEKKKEKKQKQKEKIKMKKEIEKKEAEELAARAAFLAMSDREKRAAAAEARLARLGGPRCIQCGVAYTGPGFEYMELKFCSPACVTLHRRKQPT